MSSSIWVSGHARDMRLHAVELPRGIKRAILVTNDLFVLSLALWLAFSLRLNTLYVPPSWEFGLLLAAAPLIGVATFSYLGLYRLVTRFIGAKGTTRIFLAVLLAVTIWSLLLLLSGIQSNVIEETVPRSSVLMFAALSVALVWGSRQVGGWILSDLAPNLPMNYDPDRPNALIYGAGHAGVQLAAALRHSGDYNLLGFVDEQPSLWGQKVASLKVYRPLKLAKLVQRNTVQEILLAIPSASVKQRRAIIRRLEKFPVVVKLLPAMADIAAGRVSVNDLRHVDAEDLLGRDPVPPDPKLLSQHITDQTVLVTGAGGSIGSELTRQILVQNPKQLILLDASEVALYEIEREVQALAPHNVKVTSVLGSVCDPDLVRRVLRRYEVDAIYHAAAYKHVPIVELNPIIGIANNTFGTLTVADAARDCGIKRFVLISTDKAVRPTNIMGASKRLAEMILQAYADVEKRKAALKGDVRLGTIFTIVRFGNVLDSSGSVVRLFREQIAAGGPVTVTHPKITRYFMSIPEAATLVIQAGSMGVGGEVFVLDMGRPVQIDQLARSMIRLMGLEVLDENSPDGDIVIEYKGLRPGEKLYEELLIGENTTGTSHPRIACNQEPYLEFRKLVTVLERLKQTMDTDDIDAIRQVLREAVEGYQPELHLDPPQVDTEEKHPPLSEPAPSERHPARMLH